MIKYITFDINAVEDIKMGSQRSQKDNEYALNYIAGSAIRGAYISRYLRFKNITTDISKDKELREKLLTGIRFLNAYPDKQGNRSVPFPCCFYADKNDIKEFNQDKYYKMPVCSEFDDDIPDDYKRANVSDFCIILDDAIETVDVEKKFNLHITTKHKGSNIFRYEAIKAGQVFKGIIAVDTETSADAEECADILKDAVFYLGGSKGSGYGRCCISDVKILDENPEDIYCAEEDDYDGEFYLLAMSDIISVNRFGQVIGYIDEELLKNELNVDEVKLKEASIQTQEISGYNNLWGCRPPEIRGIKSGSIFKYKYSGTLKLQNIKKLQDKGVGLRLEEGFGRILILDSLDIRFVKRISENNRDVFPQELTQEEKYQMQRIVDGIYRNALEKQIDSKILELSRGSDLSKLNRSQIGKLIENSINARNKEVSDGKKYFIDYLNHISDKKLNKRVFKQFEDAKIKSKKLYQFLIEYIEHSDDVLEFKRSYAISNDICIGGIIPNIDESFVFRFNMVFLERFFRYILRKGGNE